ncbi:hypothetical protein Sste5346_010059 [Sporothrix stenoceras]|uniref:Alpha/beta hydrolase fold-3 domain-containing protein n=1 Tax=Sporothrix stenoceras TaxID=5173 RepID=A0ABR3YH57_9PEZI
MATDTFQDPGVHISWSEKLSLAVYLAFIIVPKAVVSATRASLMALSRGLSPRLYLRCGVLGVALANLTPAQLQYVSNTSIYAYRSWAKSMAAKVSKVRGRRDKTVQLDSLVATEIQSLPDGRSSILWMGDRKKATKYVLFLHGGGYVAPLMRGHLEWCWRVFVEPHVSTFNEIAVAILDYTLCPHAQFPTQLRQAVDALQFLLSTGVRPDQILVGGDSAGGNLTAHLLSHLARPDTAQAPAVQIDQPLRGAFLVSPWMSPDTTHRSMIDNHGIDMLAATHIQDASRNFYGEGPAMTDMLDEKTYPFEGIDAVISDVYVTAGQQEVLRDQAVVLVDRLRQRNPNLPIRLEVANDEAHDFILLEGEEHRTGSAMERMKAWSKDLIQG